MKTWFNDKEQSFLFYLFLVLFATFVAVMFFETVEIDIGQLLGLSEQKNAILTFLGLSMGGVLLVMQTIIANTRAEAMEKAALEQAKANENAEKGQRQERLRNAIEHLGHDSVSIRLGGAYELFHLAQDTEELNQRQSIFDILCAHIRQTTSQDEYKKKFKSNPSEEIQSLLKLLFVQDHNVFKGLHINLQSSWLNGADLNNARLQGANISNAILKGTWLVSAYMQGSELVEARMQEVKLERAQMQGAKLWKAQLQGAYLQWTNLQGADLFQAQFQGADLFKTQLQGTSSTQPSDTSSFETRIKDRINEKSELFAVVFEGGIKEEDLDSLVEGLSNDDATHLRAKLRRQRHVRDTTSHKPPNNSGAITGSYTKEDAGKWIAEYNEATSAVSKDENR